MLLNAMFRWLLALRDMSSVRVLKLVIFFFCILRNSTSNPCSRFLQIPLHDMDLIKLDKPIVCRQSFDGTY